MRIVRLIPLLIAGAVHAAPAKMSSRVHTRDLPAVAGFTIETRYASRFLTRCAGFGMTAISP